MRSKWQKLASQAQKTCTLYNLHFQLFCVPCFQRITFLRTYLTSLQLVGEWDCMAEVKRLPVLHYSVDFIFLSFMIMDSIVEL